jgi:vacuolar protein sorting-associated protein 26
MLKQERPPEKEKGSVGFFSKFLKKVDGCDLEFAYTGKEEGQQVTIDDPYDRTSEKMHLFRNTEAISGNIVLKPKSSGYKHLGILVELLGVITTLGDREDKLVFLRQEKRFEPDTLQSNTNLDFQFSAPKEYESYRGVNAKVSYCVQITINRPVKNIVEKDEVWVSKIDEKLSEVQPDASAHRSYFRETAFSKDVVAMDVGVDNVLHIEFKYDKKIFHLEERILGMVTFKVMSLDLQYGEVGIVRKEYIGPGKPTDAVETETLQKFEIMDGTPIVGEVVPIRLYLKSIPRLTPTYTNVHNCFRVLYFVNLVLVTGEGKRYFKQQEITLYRRTGQERPANMQVY